MREIFTGAAPWCIAPNEREPAKQQLKERLSRLNYIKIDRNQYREFNQQHKNKSDVLCTFSFDDPNDSWHSCYDFGLLLNDRKELMIGYSYGKAVVVSSLAEIEAFIAACQAQFNRQAALANRRQKVREFKAQAIIAQVKQIAAEDRFEFFTENDTIKLKLSIRLDKNQAIQINIPFNRFQEVLSKLRSIIASVREVYQQGVHFKMKQIGSREQSKFIHSDADLRNR
ncbi:MAG: hypothetical protein IPL59_03540 [Candidatus Competibacteraceae bacterium]|nr:hypothetical protein [Candidatus Contendobacter odensis]MBK8534258.1 hypothetical protein [Candidatus Competibacteraceae bacterium]